MMHICMLVYMYVHIHKWINTILSQNIFFPSLLAQKIILAKKKKGITATAEGVPCYVQCNIPTWTVRKVMCTHEKVAIDNPFYAEIFFRPEPFSKQCPWLTSFPFACDIGAYNWMTFCTHKKVTMGSPFMQKNFFYAKNPYM